MVPSLSQYVSQYFCMTDLIVILSTCDSEEEATRLARQLVERGLAACVNVIPGIRSVYRWQGRVETGNEWLLLIKSSRQLFAPLSEWLDAAHSYEVPEAIAIPILDGSLNYMDWLRSNIGPKWIPQS
jgi:periplasmic divalent cation tolerance protein